MENMLLVKKQGKENLENVNMLIFLHHNLSYIPEKTTIYLPSRTDTQSNSQSSSSNVSHVDSIS